MTTTKEVKAAKQRQKTVKEAVDFWKSQAKILGVTNAGKRGGENQITRSCRPMQTAKALVREFQERAAKGTVGVEDQPIADLSDVQVLRSKLVRRDGAVGFPSDPRVRMFNRLELEVIDGMPLAQFKQRARMIEGMRLPYPERVRAASGGSAALWVRYEGTGKRGSVTESHKRPPSPKIWLASETKRCEYTPGQIKLDAWADFPRPSAYMRPSPVPPDSKAPDIPPFLDGRSSMAVSSTMAA